MEFYKIATTIHSLYNYEVYLTFFYTYKNCIITENNLIGFCNSFNLSYELITSKLN
jgi:hypothetical protein